MLRTTHAGQLARHTHRDGAAAACNRRTFTATSRSASPPCTNRFHATKFPTAISAHTATKALQYRRSRRLLAFMSDGSGLSRRRCRRAGASATRHTHSELERRDNTVTGNARHAATAAAPRATSANGRHAPSANARVLLSATMAARELSIAVLGAGCVGTSTALALMEAGFRRVTLIAHRRTPHTLSDGAGALWMPYKCGDTPYSLIRCASVSHSITVSVDVRAWSLCLLQVAWVCGRDVCVFAGGGVRDVVTFVDAVVTGAGGGRTSRGYATTPS
jgi:hypothetical protein